MIIMENNKIQELQKCVEKMSGRKIATPKDFEWLAERIKCRLDAHISATTLKRIWGYLSDENNPRIGSLSVLARYAGYADWHDFCDNVDRSKELPSNMILGRHINVPDLKKGAVIELTWRPDRMVRIRYNGGNRFEVIESKNSKLNVGDAFTCSVIIEDEPLYLSNLPYAAAYVCGKNSGVHFEIITAGK